MPLRRRYLPLSLMVLWACVRTAPQPTAVPPVEPPAFTVPEGCESSLAGTWRHATEPRFQYLASDDGGTLLLTVHILSSNDAGMVPRRFRLDAGSWGAAPAPVSAPTAETGVAPFSQSDSSIRVELSRTPGGFVGATLAPLTHPSGRVCEGRFLTKVVSCSDGGLKLETQSSTALGDACQTPARPLELPAQTHLLLRAIPGA